MSDTVKNIISLFENLDAFEAIELVESLNKRGYSLTVKKIGSDNSNEIWEPSFDAKRAGLFLAGFRDDKKIMAIKMIRDLPIEINNLYDKRITFGLKEAKDYVEMDTLQRRNQPFIVGEKKDIEKAKHIMNKKDYDIVFETVDFI